MKLGVNIDHVATLREQRQEGLPDPVQAALIAQKNGADSIVAHLREDRRHIQDRDIRLLKNRLRIPLAMEMAATTEMTGIALRVRPSRVCLVPEKRRELTTEGGLNVIKDRLALQKTIQKLSRRNIDVSLFVDPDIDQVRCAKAVGATIVEFHTGRYARLKGEARARELGRLRQAADVALRLQLRVHAGHGLDYKNVQAVARIRGMEELNIGFSIITRAIFDGLARAVRDMKELSTCAAS